MIPLLKNGRWYFYGLTVDGHAGYAFENDVKMYGTQTWLNRLMNMKMFENDVKMYGS